MEDVTASSSVQTSTQSYRNNEESEKYNCNKETQSITTGSVISMALVP